MSHLSTAYKIGAAQAQDDFDRGIVDVGQSKVVPPPSEKIPKPPTPKAPPAAKPAMTPLPEPVPPVKPASMTYNDNNSVN